MNEAREAAFVSLLRQLGRLMHDEDAWVLADLGVDRLDELVRAAGFEPEEIHRVLEREHDWAWREIKTGYALAFFEQADETRAWHVARFLLSELLEAPGWIVAHEAILRGEPL